MDVAEVDEVRSRVDRGRVHLDDASAIVAQRQALVAIVAR